MISKSKIIVVAAALTAGIVSPVIAQEADHTGSQMPYYYDGTGGQVRGSWGPQDAATAGRPAAHHSRRVQ